MDQRNIQSNRYFGKIRRNSFPIPITPFGDNLLLHTKHRNVYHHCEIIRPLGEGSMGFVSCVRMKKSSIGGSAYISIKRCLFGMTNIRKSRVHNQIMNECRTKYYALKSILLSRLCPEFIAEFRNEVSVLQTLDHPNIVRAYEMYETKHNLYLLLEYCSGGDLYSRMPYSEKESIKIVRRLLSALSYMHNQSIAHRDVKFENVIFENNHPDAEIKLIDFGLSMKCKTRDQIMTQSYGTIYTMSPQVLRGSYSSQTDVWSVGVVTYMLVSGRKPFDLCQKNSMLRKIYNCEYDYEEDIWKSKSIDSREFIDQLLVFEENERYTANQALSHHWLSNDLTTTNEKLMVSIHKEMLDYKSVNELKKLALIIIAHKSSSTEIMELRNIFKTYDRLNDGRISLSEFQLVMKDTENNKYTQKEIDYLFKNVDTNKDGYIYYTEFLAATLKTQGRIQEERLASAFERFDSDDTGFISRENLRIILGSDYTKEKVDKIMLEADENGDGVISFQEFLDVFRRENGQKVNNIRGYN